jgi:hypothetical protein
MMIPRGAIPPCVGLFGWLACTSGLLAQNAPVEQPANPAVSAFPAGYPWDDIVIDWTEARYKVEALRFKARDESGFDWPGSDEVMVTTDDAEGWTVSNEIDDIDSGDTHAFDPGVSCILGVRPGVVVLGESSVCDDAGEPGPLGFHVEMWEKDAFGFPPGFCNVLPPSPSSGMHGGPHCPNDGDGDDFLGGLQVDLSLEHLEEALATVGAELVETVVLSPCEGGGACGGWDLPDYSFTYRVTRLPDAQTDFRSQLEAAMRRSGARGQTEAVVIGLRSLRAPAPHEVEPEGRE